MPRGFSLPSDQNIMRRLLKAGPHPWDELFIWYHNGIPYTQEDTPKKLDSKTCRQLFKGKNPDITLYQDPESKRLYGLHEAYRIERWRAGQRESRNRSYHESKHNDDF